ncbi:MAG: NADP-dependent isocitrate dehydrogenase [Thermotogae bacterium]|nr:NADP-dependent isocitrate dehydrogenase [Thermotogota bacterium]
MLGNTIKIEGTKLLVPDDPIIVYIEGDGIGPYIMEAAMYLWNGVVEKVYDGRRRIHWKEAKAGEKALKEFGTPLPDETIEAIRYHRIAIKGPLATPVGEGYRSLNVTMRQQLDLYACVRPVRWLRGVFSPLKNPEKVDVVIFRENTEDVYAGIEWPVDSEETEKLRVFLKEKFGVSLRPDTGIGIKPISEHATKRLMRMALEYALRNGRKSVTIVHKGNIMKYTEGAFLRWCKEVAKEEYGDRVCFEDEGICDGKIVIKDRIADDMFQQMLLYPEDYDVLVTPNLNGDYLSDACAAMVGGVGMVPGANIGDAIALFEPTHGTAPRLKNPEYANPMSLILSGAMMLDYIGWIEAANAVRRCVEMTVAHGYVTPDLKARMKDAKEVSAFGFVEKALENV